MINAILNAESLAQKGNLQESYDAFTEILAKEPDNVRSLMGLGVVCFKSSKNKEAITAFKRILELKNNHLDALKSLSMVFAAEKEYDQSLVTIKTLVGLRKKDPEILAFAARILQSAGQKETALEHIDRALELTANNYVKQNEFNDVKAVILGLPKPSVVKNKANLTVCCLPGMDNFIHENIKRLSLYANITTSVTTKSEEHIKNIIKADIVWLEWANQLTQAMLTQKNILQNKKIIVRIHNYELYDGLVEHIDFSLATDLVFVSSFMRDIFVKKNLPTAQNCRLHVIHNAVDIRRFAYFPRNESKINIAVLTNINFKTDPIVILLAFSFLFKRYPDLKLHIAGQYQDSRNKIAIPYFLEQAGWADRVIISDYVGTPEEWFKDKDFILSSSLNESQGIALLEALSMGTRPLIYNFPGAKDIYLPNQLWTTFDDLEDRFLHGPEPKEASDFVAKYYSKEREINSWLKLILNGEHIEENFDFSVKE
jgi:hypothetical protein